MRTRCSVFLVFSFECVVLDFSSMVGGGGGVLLLIHLVLMANIGGFDSTLLKHFLYLYGRT